MCNPHLTMVEAAASAYFKMNIFHLYRWGQPVNPSPPATMLFRQSLGEQVKRGFTIVKIKQSIFKASLIPELKVKVFYLILSHDILFSCFQSVTSHWSDSSDMLWRPGLGVTNSEPRRVGGRSGSSAALRREHLHNLNLNGLGRFGGY